MKNYTGMYIIRPTLTEEGYKAVVADINAIFEAKGGKVLEVNEWGIRDLAYEIAKCRKGYYVVLNVTATAEALNEFNRLANIKENVIRHIVVAE